MPSITTVWRGRGRVQGTKYKEMRSVSEERDPRPDVNKEHQLSRAMTSSECAEIQAEAMEKEHSKQLEGTVTTYI